MAESVKIKDQVKNWIYLNLEQAGDRPYPFASVRFGYNKPILEEQKKYDVYVERLLLPLQTIPFVSEMPIAITTVPRQGGAVTIFTVVTSFSLKGFFTATNNLVITNGGPAAPTLAFNMTASGRMRLSYDDFFNFSLTLSDDFRDIFEYKSNLVENLGVGDGVNAVVIGASSILDRLDELRTIEIVAAELVSRSELYPEREERILTDFVLSNNYSTTTPHSQTMSVVSTLFDLTDTGPRQDLLVTPQYPRKLLVK